ncbi:MAG: helix-turn-helix domain-containing protein [Oscillospiraceae bacterium]|nr:helix-turn-helix domain-containing protein [Oscillospiraceae bacterium]
MMTTGMRIAEARKRAGLTQAKVAEKMDVSFQAVSAWERDEYLPDTDKLASLAKVLDSSVSYLIEGRAYDVHGQSEIFDWEHMKTFVKTTAKQKKMENTAKALDFAVKAHDGQLRKKSDIPYISHPLTLACHCLAMDICDDAVIAACLLHDVIEDCGVTRDELPVDEETKHIVELLTREKDDSRREKILKEYYGAISGNPKAALIKCVDRCNNLSTMSWGLSRDRQFRYIDETDRYVLPLLKVVKAVPEFNNAAWLLQYQIETMVDLYKRML